MTDKPSFYSILTADVRYDERIGDFAKLLYSDLTARCNRKGYCWPTNEQLAEDHRKNARTIVRTLRELESAGYIATEVIRDQKNMVVERRIWLDANARAGLEFLRKPPDKNVTAPPDKNVMTPPDKNVKYIKENNININNPLTPTGESELFDEFWAAYPKHVAKKPARRAWDKLHADRDLLDALLTALEWQTRTEAWQRDGGRYVPNPATWLNGRRWEDEPQEETEPDKPPRRRKEETEVW